MSLDITSLFTNVPLQATVQIILDKIFLNEDDLFHNFNKADFKKFLEIAVLDTNFIFNKTVFKQIDGVAMGSPLGPAFANSFMSWFEAELLDNCHLLSNLYSTEDTLTTLLLYLPAKPQPNSFWNMLTLCMKI